MPGMSSRVLNNFPSSSSSSSCGCGQYSDSHKYETYLHVIKLHEAAVDETALIFVMGYVEGHSSREFDHLMELTAIEHFGQLIENCLLESFPMVRCNSAGGRVRVRRTN